ncbi:MAG TPA: SDR family NAD(P)-dependent oxidoreductase [Candidatus Angelobacter sp.]|nr:SDR family NAD(P)-dependent oxidoreductase [Candidatus Angelobacter sp.]
MKMQSNTILITGGTSGIGKGLAEAFHRLGNQVVITGRREERLRSIAAANPGMRYFPMDVADPQSVSSTSAKILGEFPALNCVFNNAGIQNRHDFASGQPVNDAAILAEVQTNLLGLIRVTLEFLPQLKKQPDAVLLNVSSGLAFVPMAVFPVYCATKAAVHSFTLTLRQQLRNSGMRVIELIPPYVATELGGPSKPPAPGALRQMPLETFVAETMKELAGDADEIAIGGAKNLYTAVNPENVNRILAGRNAAS